MATTATERKLLIDGEWIETGAWLEVRSPYDGSLVGRVAKGGAAEARSAVDAAERAMSEPLPAHERAAILDRTARLVDERADEIARTISAEAGKPMKAARIEVARAQSTFTMAAVEARKLAGDVVPMDASPAGSGKLALTLRVPIGVVGAISPFNFPFNLVAHKVAPALAAGCAVVLKPASQTPLSALLLAELEAEAGLPRGWLNVVCGPASEIGDVLVEDERVALITFTGSAGVGWKLRERAPRKRVNLELGNATPVIVAADADLDDVADAARRERVLLRRPELHLGAADLRRALGVRPVPRAASFRASRLWSSAILRTTRPTSVPSSRRASAIACSSGSRRLVVSERGYSPAASSTESSFVRPSSPTRRPTSKVACEEVFGPLCTVAPYDSLDEAIALANGTRYGLQAGIFTSDVKAALRAARELEFGGVTVNEAPTFRADQMPYGGVKDSGNTREGPAYAIREMTEERLVVLQL